MTDKLKETVETAIQELKQVVATLNASRVWRGTCWEYSPMLPDQYLPLRNTIDWQAAYLRSALAEWTPDDTAYRPSGLSMPVDRGAWSNVENATKWVDDLRGDEPDLLNQTCCGCGRSGGYALYCGWCWSKGEHVADVNTSEERVPNPAKQRHEWQWLTEEDIHDLFMSNETVDDYGEFETIACAVSTKLKEKNNG